MALDLDITADEVWRDYVTDGLPASGAHSPDKADARLWGTGIERILRMQERYVSSYSVSVTPTSPSEGLRYIVAPGTAGPASGHINDIAEWTQGAWQYTTPSPGYMVWATTERAYVYWDEVEGEWLLLSSMAGSGGGSSSVTASSSTFRAPVISATTTTPPGSPTSGDRYLVPLGGTGAWTSKDYNEAVWGGASWAFTPAVEGWQWWDKTANVMVVYDGSSLNRLPFTTNLNSATPFYQLTNQDGRIAGIGKTNGHGAGARFTVRWTADQRILVCGATGTLTVDITNNNNYAAYTINWPRLTNGNILNIYCGYDYFIIRTDKSVGNLFFVGVAGNGQGGQGNTTSQNKPVVIPYFAAMFVTDVYTESTMYTSGSGTQARFWFAITSDNKLHGCGAGANYTQGNNATTDVSTPHVITDISGNPLLNIVGVACSTVHAPVFAWTSDGKCWVWGTGSAGAHGQGHNSSLPWPVLLGGSANPWTGITKAAVSGSSITYTLAVAMIIRNGKIQIAGSNYYGNGNGQTIANTVSMAFTDATGAIASETAIDIGVYNGETNVCTAVTSPGSAWVCGYNNNYAQGDGTTNNRNVFYKPSLPVGADGTVTKIRIGGGNTYTTSYIEAAPSGVKKLYSCAYNNYQSCGQNWAGGTVGSFQEVQGLIYNLLDWQTVGDYSAITLHVLTDDGRDRACGYNDIGQTGTQPSNLHNVPILQPCTNEVRLVKGLTWTGAYNSATNYTPNDLLSYTGGCYINKLACVNVLPTNTTYFDPFPLPSAITTAVALPGVAPTTGNLLKWLSATQAGDAGSFADLFKAAGNFPYSTVASAATLDLSNSNPVNVITGTTTIVSIGMGAKQLKILFFQGALTLTYNATSLILPTAQNVALPANSVGIFVSDASGNVTCISLLRGDGLGVTANHATLGIGYTTGSGGTVTQATSRTTGVTLNKINGQITTTSTSLAAGASATFTVTNSAIAATDVVNVSIKSGQTNKETSAHVTAVAAGSFDITIFNRHASTAETGAIIINFAVLKAVAA